jgi:hypothetical protein
MKIRRRKFLHLAAGAAALSGSPVRMTDASLPSTSRKKGAFYVLRQGLVRLVVNEAEDALLGLGHEIYQRGGLSVRPVLTKLKASDGRDTETWRLIPASSSPPRCGRHGGTSTKQYDGVSSVLRRGLSRRQ